MPQKINSQQLQIYFMEALNNVQVTFIDGLNPSHVMIAGEEYYIFIKNLSPAYLQNPDIWRAQLPIKEEFNAIKNSETTFILLGYDADNDVYATWNPVWAKQRLNIAESVSFYSRLSLQQEVSRTKQIKRQTLNNDGEVIVFPRELLQLFFTSYKGLFQSTGDYVAMGSKRRPDANTAFKTFSNLANVHLLASFMSNKGYSEVTTKNYIRAIKELIQDGTISKFRKIFLAYDGLEDYSKAIDVFIKVPEINVRNGNWNHTFSAALHAYLNCLIKQQKESEEKTESILEDPHMTKQNPQQDTPGQDYESPYVDNQGRLTRIVNPTLLELLHPCLNTEYRELIKAYNIIADFYGDRFKCMELSDWNRLFQNIDWHNPQGQYETDIYLQPAKSRRRKASILQVNFPNGRIIKRATGAETFAQVIDEHYPELIAEIGLIHAGVPIVSKELDKKYAKYQKPISGGWYVFTNLCTEKKQEMLQKISDEMGLGLKVSVIYPDEERNGNTPNVATSDVISSSRAKIRIEFPDGKTFQPNKVLEALVEVVKFAGAEKVRTLNLMVCGDNLVLKEPHPLYKNACKAVGDGWLCNTCSDTRKKLEQIHIISRELNLGIKAYLV